MTAEGSGLLIETQYLPPIASMALMVHYGEVVLEGHETYQKGSFRNRCYLAGPNGPLRLSVPLASGKHQQRPIRAVRTAPGSDWARQHWRSIQSAYGKAPFFEHYAPELQSLFDHLPGRLFDLNHQLLMRVIDLLHLPIRVRISSEYADTAPAWLDDRRDAIRPGADPVPGFRIQPYPQVFEDRHGFLPNMSILDLLFCAGPQAPLILASSVRKT